MKTKVISEMRRSTQKEKVYPFIRLRGKWIADAGISIGETLQVSVVNDCIVISKKKGGSNEGQRID